MLFRACVRTTAVNLLTAAIVQSGAQVSSSKDTPVQTGSTPSVIVYTDDVKEGVGTTPPTFSTTVMTTIELIAEGNSQGEAETLCDTLCCIIEETLLNGGSPFQKLFEKIDSVQTVAQYQGLNAKKHTFSAVIEIKAHVTETFEPAITEVLSGLNIFVDSGNIFDPNGTYTPPFAYPVAAAPRSAGPDGRTEITASFEIPTE